MNHCKYLLSVQKRTKSWKTPFLTPFCPISGPPEFFSKTRLHHFWAIISVNFMQKIRKILRAVFEKKVLQTDGDWWASFYRTFTLKMYRSKNNMVYRQYKSYIINWKGIQMSKSQIWKKRENLKIDSQLTLISCKTKKINQHLIGQTLKKQTLHSIQLKNWC